MFFIQGNEKENSREAVLKELVDIWRKGGGWYPRPEHHQDQNHQIQSVLSSIVGGLKSLGIIPRKSMDLPSLHKSLDRNRLSGFLYNISMYLQEMSTELDDHQALSDQHFWENLLHSFLQSDGRSPPSWTSRVPPRPSFRLQELFLSLRGSPHWDGLLGLVQSVLTVIEQQPQRPVLTFMSQNWKTISALLDTVLQALVSGTYSQASAGLQGFICILKGQNECGFNLTWLQQLLTFLETRNWKPVVNLHPGVVAGDHREGRLKPLRGQMNNETMTSVKALLMQALSGSNPGERAAQFGQRNPALVQGLDGLRRGFLRRVGSTVYGNLRSKVSRVTMALLDDLGSTTEDPPSTPERCSVGQ